MTKVTCLESILSRRWKTLELWSSTEEFEGNPVEHLAVPAGTVQVASNLYEPIYVTNNFGTWPAAFTDAPLSLDTLWMKLPREDGPHSPTSEANWNVPSTLLAPSAAQILDTYKDAIGFSEEREETPGLRAPQLGALHSVLGYWTTKRTIPATVVMPTGTGKTDTMLALLVAGRLPKLLVLVPSDALREQISAKFKSLGVLQELGIVSNAALRPRVGKLSHGIHDETVATKFAEASNVIVTTPSALRSCSPHALDVLLGSCSHLFIDEAHHVAAPTWAEVRRRFDTKPVVQFTATPFREDGQHLQGEMIYSFPLREAQRQGYFSQINYTSVVDLDDVDRLLAEQSIKKLKADLDAGYDHVLMARVKSVPRAQEILPLYQQLAPELRPTIVNSQLPQSQQRSALRALAERTSRIVVCVNMLGEGFDLPALKIAAVHDPQKSLGVTLQFIGRFARTSDTGAFGDASIFVARNEIEEDKRLRELYAEDSDWNIILRNLTEAAAEEQRAINALEKGFTSLPTQVNLRNLRPKMSTVVYRAMSASWEPQNIVTFFGDENLLTSPFGLNANAGLAWCVVERRRKVRWANLKTIHETSYELYVFYFDAHNQLLYINHSANDGVFERLAEAIVGADAQRFTGSSVYRVMADIDRLVPTNVGVLDVHNQFRRFSMHVGSDVTSSFSQAEASTKSQTNISGGGYRNGEYTNISASVKGRIWTHSTAPSLKHWRDWCDSVGEKLLDDSITIDRIINQFILPQYLDQRPEGVLLALEWPWYLYTVSSDYVRLSYQAVTHEALYTDLVPDTSQVTGPFRFSVRTASWEIGYEAHVENAKIKYRCVSKEEIKVLRGNTERPLSEWLNQHGVTIILDEDRIIHDDLLYKPNWENEPFNKNDLILLDWSGTTLTVESQTEKKLANSVQFRAISDLKSDPVPWDVVIDDDGTGEIADIVALRIDNSGLLIRLIHCKYSENDAPGARVADLYEVCGQAQKSVSWRRDDLRQFFRKLKDRASKKQRRTGISPFEVGDLKKLNELQEKSKIMKRRMEINIVQPGLSASKATTQQLDLLASTQAYLKTTINAPLFVSCSA